ncbi:hypothetical protein NHX12_014302 [Muraenolepis orangiensis]|uniref:RBR-type E3 ubiquitin transferase n=1 Tax=Muraenolepis orangiensis TaxID=630683 RepID=A0A9Q0I5H0_9TELE|nr:hypothetical protein NHX12_014302 [Muraenolepis orangiensis]
MSCGHSTTPGSLTGWCRSLLKQGQCKFTCPALKPDGKVCGVELSYREVRRVAALTVDEMKLFEERLAHLTICATCKIKKCPGCRTYVERQTKGNLCFSCPICKKSNRPSHEFCWQCLQPWKGPAPRVDHCENPGCVDMDLQVLQRCRLMVLSDVPGVPHLRHEGGARRHPLQIYHLWPLQGRALLCVSGAEAAVHADQLPLYAMQQWHRPAADLHSQMEEIANDMSRVSPIQSLNVQTFCGLLLQATVYYT